MTVDNGFTYLFDGQTIDDWCMAGPGKFVIIESEKMLQSQGGMGFYGIPKRSTRILY